MARFQLCVARNGSALLTTDQPLDPAQVAAIRTAFEAWRAGDPPQLAISPDTELIPVGEIELDLEAAVAAGAS